MIPDIARTDEDFNQVVDLMQRLAPNLTMPPVGRRGNTVYVCRDGDNRSKILAVCHVESCLEVRHLLVEPDCKFKEFSYNMLHRGMEMNMRTSGVEQYYFTVQDDNKRVIDMFRQDGAEIIDTNVVRFRKRL